MHKIKIPQWAIDRTLERRGKLHVHENLDPRKTALIVVLSASSRPPCANGPTPQPSTPRSSDATLSPFGCIATTGTGCMLASTKCRPSVASA